MNTEIKDISKNIIEMNEEERADLMEQASQTYAEKNTRVKELNSKYQKLADNYFRNYKR
ncbi:hypothetical protein CLHUN_30030 [Ruminiclostridium hungatei]|uniref:Uncharacterized protein n=1 Tax=Ruminiclostridium hungatei TaxID=48256 RepID=A0A1V4SH43_RUMHU|nr:hypothetical protein [Ruminiclostridium hungatei]OPX43063.1 hypothetical protein CLHUN_30030 [Ruminiclostridium hungatei]